MSRVFVGICPTCPSVVCSAASLSVSYAFFIRFSFEIPFDARSMTAFFFFFFIVLSYNAADFYAHVQLTKRGSVWLEFESRPLSTFDFLFCRISARHQPLVWPVKGRSEC